MKQDFDKLFKAIDDAQSLTDSELEELIAGFSADERDMLNAMVATKRAMQRDEAMKSAEGVADEAWKAFEQQNFSGPNISDNLVPLRPLWHKIAAAVIAVVVISGLTVAAVRGNWLRIEKVPEAVVEQTAEPLVVTDSAAADSVATGDVPQMEILDDVTLETLLARMAEHYGVTVQFADDALRTVRLHFEWDKSLTLERNVQLLNNFSKLSVSIENEVVIVSNPEEK